MNRQPINSYTTFEEIKNFLLEATKIIVDCPNDISHFVGFNHNNYYKIQLANLQTIEHDLLPQHIILADYSFKIINGLLSSYEVEAFKKLYSQLNKQTMASYAVQSKFKSEDNGIQRASIYDYQLAFHLFSKVFRHLEITKIINNELYVACQLNPLLRFIEYQHNNCLIPHHDTCITINENIISASTVIFYLTDNNLGKTRIISEYLKDITNIQNNDILYEVMPESGKCMIFDHNILHDSGSFHKTQENESNKLILTTEVLYYKILK